MTQTTSVCVENKLGVPNENPRLCFSSVTNKVSLHLRSVTFNKGIERPCKVANWPTIGFSYYWLLYWHTVIGVIGNYGRSNDPLLSQVQDSHEKEKESEESQVSVILMERFGPRYELRDVFEQQIEKPHLQIQNSHTHSAQIVRGPKSKIKNKNKNSPSLTPPISDLSQSIN